MRKKGYNHQQPFFAPSDVDTRDKVKERLSLVGPSTATSSVRDSFYSLQQGNKNQESETRVDDQYFTKAIDTHFLGGSYYDIQNSDDELHHARRQSSTFLCSSPSQSSPTLSDRRQVSGEDEMEVPDDRTPLVSKSGRALSGYGGVLMPIETGGGTSTNKSDDSLIDIEHDGKRYLFFLIEISIGRNQFSGRCFAGN